MTENLKTPAFNFITNSLLLNKFPEFIYLKNGNVCHCKTSLTEMGYVHSTAFTEIHQKTAQRPKR